MGNATQHAVANVTPLLAIGDGGLDDVDMAVRQINLGNRVVVVNPTLAAEVLRYFGCSEEWISLKINYALTGEWPDRIG